MSSSDHEPAGDAPFVPESVGPESRATPAVSERRQMIKSIVASVPVVLTVAAGTAHAQQYTYNVYPPLEGAEAPDEETPPPPPPGRRRPFF